jgi:serine/threonine protein kinase KIN1/2
MLATNPAARAPLSEVLSHPWIIKGFSGAPDAHLLHREPLRVDELDPQVIRGMNGFEFGTEEEIERRLVAILESEAYRRAVHVYECKRDPGGSSRNGTLLSRWIDYVTRDVFRWVYPRQQVRCWGALMTPSTKNKRFSGFDFYRRRLFAHSPSTSQSHVAQTLSVEYPMDPTKGFHPLISMYYLVREKMEREGVYRCKQSTSSQLITGLHDDPDAQRCDVYCRCRSIGLSHAPVDPVDPVDPALLRHVVQLTDSQALDAFTLDL